MDYDKKIEHIKKLQKKSYKGEKNPAAVILNFYTILTIVLVSVVILLYSNYIAPSYKAKELQLQKDKERQEYLKMRQKQIELSHKLNSKENTQTDEK
jgi:hypothetical protein